MTDIVNHPTCQHVSAMNCVDAAHLAVADLIGLAKLLRRAIVADAPPGVSELYAVSNTVLRDADRLDASLALWHRLPADSLSSSHHRRLQRRIEALHQHAEVLAQAADATAAADSETPTADQLATLADHLLAMTEPLHQAIGAAHAASIAPPPATPLH